jgi:hypothetical protein
MHRPLYRRPDKLGDQDLRVLHSYGKVFLFLTSVAQGSGNCGSSNTSASPQPLVNDE